MAFFVFYNRDHYNFQPKPNIANDVYFCEYVLTTIYQTKDQLLYHSVLYIPIFVHDHKNGSYTEKIHQEKIYWYHEPIP